MVLPMASNKRKKKSMQTALYGKIKQSRETGGGWLIGGNTHDITFQL